LSSSELRYWARDDMLAYALRRGRSLRRRRRTVAVGAAAAVATALFGVTVGWGTTGSRTTGVHVLNRPTTTMAVPSGQAVSTPQPSAAVLAPVTTATTASHSPRGSIAAPSAAASAGRPTECTPSDLSMLVTSDYPTYPSTMQVQLSAQVINIGKYICHLTFTDLGIFDASGTACDHVTPYQPFDETLRPGDHLLLPYVWGQHCSAQAAGGPRLYAPAGHYTGVVRMGWIGEEVSGSAGFDIVGAN
jgi:hypothetical protein